MPTPWGPTTTAIHAGRRFNPTRAVTTPIFQTSVFQLMENREGAEFAASIEPPAFYTRWGNPNTSEVEAVLAELEGAERALVAASGMAAFALVFEAFLKNGDHLVAPAAIYLGTEQLIRRWEAERGLQVTWVQNTLDLGEWEAAIRPGTAHDLGGDPLQSHPGPDGPRRRGGPGPEARHPHGGGQHLPQPHPYEAPALRHRPQRGFGHQVPRGPLGRGGGRHRRLAMRMWWPAGTWPRSWAPPWIPWPPGCCTGASRPSPCGCAAPPTTPRPWPSGCSGSPTWRGWTSRACPPTPATRSPPGRWTTGFGAMISFELRAGLEAGRRFCEALEIITRGVSLGGVESLIQHPASMSHLKTAPEVKARLGITDGLLRFSVGIEDQADLVADLEQGFQAAAQGAP